MQHDVQIRPFLPDDEESWLRCRVLSFLHTGFFDDVLTEKPDREAPIQLVAVGPGGEGASQVLGLLDVTVAGTEATMENVAIHPDHQSRESAPRCWTPPSVSARSWMCRR